MKRKISKSMLPIILLIASLTPLINAAFVVVEPEATEDDAFITGLGLYFGDTPFIYLKEFSQDLIIGSRFRNVTINQGTKINNATLWVRSIYDYGGSVSLPVRIYGDASDDSLPFNDSSSFTRTRTESYVDWNISAVNGDQWNNVTITEIVQEIVDRIGWTNESSLSLIITAFAGTPRREYVSYDGNPAYTPYINISYAIPPSPTEEEQAQDQADPPYNETAEYTWVYDDTYRGIDIYNVSQVGAWLNFSTFTVAGGAAGKITGLNDTFFQVTNMYSDSDLYMYRDFDTYRDNSSDYLATKFGIIWEALPWGGVPAYEYVNMWGVSDTHTYVDNWNDGYSYAERTWSNQAMGTAWSVLGNALSDSVNWSPLWLETTLPWTLYYHIRLDMSTMQSNVSIYNDIDMTSHNVTYTDTFVGGPGDISSTILNEYLIARFSLATANVGFTGKYISQVEDLDELFFLVYPNGTLVDTEPIPDGIDPEDYIDDLLGGAQPEDPEEDEYTIMDKFRWKLLVLAVGMIMMIGSPIAGVYYEASTATWIKLLFIMFFGLGILWQIKFM